MSSSDDVSRLRDIVKNQSSELELLRSLVHVMREDLNVKNEQFDLLYNSLKASQLHSHNENEHIILELRERVYLLERLLEEKNNHDVEITQYHSRLKQRHGTRVLDKSHTVKNLAGLDDDVLYNILNYCGGEDLARLSITTLFLRTMTYREHLWISLFNLEFKSCVPSGSSSDRSWRCRYGERKRTERNWNRGEAQRITLSGHRGTVTCLSLAKKHIVSGSDDGSLIFWGLARRSLQPSMETTPPPALALAQLAQHRKPSITSVFSSNIERSLNAFGNMSISGGSTSSHTSVSTSSVSTSSSHNNAPSSSSVSMMSHNGGSGGGGGGGGIALSHSSPSSASSAQRKVPSSSNQILQPPNQTPKHLRNMFSNNYNSKYGNSAGAELGALPRPSGAIDDVESPLTHYGLFEKHRIFNGHGGPVWCLDVDEESGTLVSGSYDRTIKVWNLWSGSCLRSLRDHTGWVSCVAIEKGGRKVVSGSWDGTFKVWDAQSGIMRASHHCGVGNTLYCLDMDRAVGGNILTVGTRQRQVQIWDLEAGQHLLSCNGHMKEVGAVQMTPTTICSGSADTTIKIWDMRDGHCGMTLRGHEATVMCLEYDPMTQRVVSGGVDKTIRLWDLRRPDQPLLQTFENVHKGDVFSVKFDEDRIVSGSADGKISVLNFNYRR